MKQITCVTLAVLLIIEFGCIHSIHTRKLISSTIKAANTESSLVSTFNSQLNLNSSDTNTKTLTDTNNTTKAVHRLVGGHLHHSVYRKEENNFSSQSPNRLSKLYFRRKPWLTSTASTLFTSTQPTTPMPRISTTTNSIAEIVTTTLAPKTTSSVESISTKEPVFIVKAQKYVDPEYEANQVINYEIKKDGFVESSAGEGKEEKKKDDSKKTLSDQVAEGKYGLIQNELFQKPPKRPGILSYATNPEVPNDTAANLGGLSNDEIWLSEDHLLVLKGGSLNAESRDEPWKPIDDYEAPLRQVKIPDNPEIPPPFLVQLEENGPIEFIGNNQMPLINPFTNESILLFPEGGFPKTETYSGDKTYLYARPGASNDSKNTNAENGFVYPPTNSFGNHRNNNFTFSNPFLSPGQLPFGGQFAPPPPFGAFGPPPFPFTNGSLENANITDFFDEDDPAFYYPPPYTFVYKKNYTNPVAPGPLVPGIILPPPPNFFGRLTPDDEKPIRTTSTSTTTTTQRPYKQVLRPVYRPTTTLATPVTKPFASEKPAMIVKAVKPTKTQTEAFRQNVLAPTRAPSVPTTTKTVTQLKKVTQQEILTFVPKEAIISDPLQNNKGNPIYYEYFDARIKTNAHAPAFTTTTTTSTTTARPHAQQQRQPVRTQLHPTAKQLRRPYNAYLPIKQPLEYEKYVLITPKPETKPNAISTNAVQIGDSHAYKNALKPAPMKTFNTEIDNIRHTIEFFKTQNEPTPKPQTSDPFLPRNPKSKAVFEFSFDATPQKTKEKYFNPPPQFDSTPFKPMVQYSPPLDSANGFKAIAYTTVPTASTDFTTTTSAPTTTVTQAPVSQLHYLPTLDGGYANGHTSKKPTIKYIPFDSSVLKSVASDDEYGKRYKSVSLDKHIEQIKQSEFSTVAPIPSVTTQQLPHPHSTVPSWITVEKQIVREVRPKEINVQIQSHSPVTRPMSVKGVAAPYESSYIDANSNDVPFNGIYYPIRTPSSYYQQQQQHHQQPQRPVMTAQQNAYLRQIDAIRQQLQRYPNQYRITIANNSIPSQNYRIPRPSNPNSEFIAPYQLESHRFPHLSQILTPNYNIHQQQQRLPAQAIHPLHRDVLVNYLNPLPEINPDSEFLPPPHLLHPLPPAVPTSPPINFNRYSRLIRKPPTVVQYKLPGDQNAGVFFYTPQDDKFSANGNIKKK